jgi:hypothetical protein
MAARQHWVVIALLFFLLGIGIGGCRSGGEPGTAANEGAEAGKPAPGFRLPRLDTGAEVAFPGDFKGRAVALMFFSPG